jgi:hypothetical protein
MQNKNQQRLQHLISRNAAMGSTSRHYHELAGPTNNFEPGEVIENAEPIVFVVDLDEDLTVRFRTCTADDLISYGDKPDLIDPEFDDNSQLELQYN